MQILKLDKTIKYDKTNKINETSKTQIKTRKHQTKNNAVYKK